MRIPLITILALALATFATAQKQKGGIAGKVAPKWQVDAWKNLPKGKKALELSDFTGKTVYLYCFQSWCPGCHSHGFPTLKKVRQKFQNDKDVVFLAVQTVFEGHATNTMERGVQTLKKFELDISLGLSGSKEKPSKLMRGYKTRGTPWTIIIGADGKVLVDGFRVDAEEAIALIEKSKKAKKSKE